VIDSAAVAECCVDGTVAVFFVFLSFTWTTKGYVPGAVALPEMTPLELSFRPGGNGPDPAANDHLRGRFPPEAARFAE
jgi:hypothetical protein